LRAGIYLRISEDRDGSQTATARQVEDCRRFCDAKRWDVVDVFEDVDVSAFRRSVKRPEFDRLLEAVRQRELDVVISWKLDRLSRRLRDFALLDEICEGAGARIVTVVDAIDTSTSAGRVVASIMTALARAESENISLRVARKHLEMAKAGPHAAQEVAGAMAGAQRQRLRPVRVQGTSL
jgi:site-specific DNA recombinase